MPTSKVPSPSSTASLDGTSRPHGLRYRSVMEVVLGMVADGALTPGDRLPSLRDMSEKLSVSVATVMRAYAELERRNLIETLPQSGHYVSWGARPAAPPPRAPAYHATPTPVSRSGLIRNILDAMTDPTVIPLGGAVPSPELLPVRDLSRLARQVLGDGRNDFLGYGPVQGDPELRRQLAFHLLDAGAKVRMDDLIVTVGATEGLHIALGALARRGDAVVVESPTYFGFLLQLEALGLKALEVPSHPEEGLDLAALESALSRGDVRACILQPNFGNPTGGLFSAPARREILRLLDRAGIPLIEDDLYGDLCFSDRRPPCFLAEDDGGRVIHVGAFSKVLAPGFRVGWVAPGRWKEELLKMKTASTLASPTATQAVLARFLAEGRYKRHIRSLRARLRTQVATVAAHVSRSFPEGTRVSSPQGGFVLWIELPPAVDALELYRRALERRIGITPGPMFSAQERFGNYIRINCGYPWSDRIREALETVGGLARELS